MSIVTVARIQHRRGVKTDLPANLNEGELGWCMDTRELFIGNSLAEGGNTQILTSSTDLAAVIRYSFVSDTSVVSNTGTSMSQPVVRTLQQQIDDYRVNVKAYGAQGDGITDDTDAINRAIVDLYTKILVSSEDPLQSKKSIWFPSGRYRTTSEIMLYPFVRLVGEHCSTTVIQMEASSPVTCVVLSVDGAGQSGTSIGNNGAVLPGNLGISHLTIRTVGSENVVVLQNTSNVTFDSCLIGANWTTGDSLPAPAPVAVVIEKLGSTIENQYFNFISCIFSNIAHAFDSSSEISHIAFQNCTFDNLYMAILSDNNVGETGPNYVTVNNCTFSNIEDRAILWLAASGITTTGCCFNNVGFTNIIEPIHWGADSLNCASMGDVFDLTFVSTPVIDLGTGNLVIDAQQNNLISSAVFKNIRIPTGASPYITSVLTTDDVLIVRTLSDIVQINLPNPSTNGRTIVIKDGEGNASVKNITIHPAASDSIESLGVGINYVINTNFDSITLIYDNILSKWHII